MKHPMLHRYHTPHTQPGFIKTTSIKQLPIAFDIEELRRATNEVLSHQKDPTKTISLVYRDGHFEDRWTDGAGSSLDFDHNGLPICDADGNYIRRFVETEFTHLNPEVESTYLKHVYSQFARRYRVSRFRLACLRPKTSYSWHSDEEVRIHVPVMTSPGAFLITEDGYATHLPADGSSYVFDARGYHTAVNSDRVLNRYHLLINLLP
jgi:hypothetical protein